MGIYQTFIRFFEALPRPAAAAVIFQLSIVKQGAAVLQ